MRKIYVVLLIFLTLIALSQFLLKQRVAADTSPQIRKSILPAPIIEDPPNLTLVRPSATSLHFSFDNATMPTSFLEHLQYMSRSVNRNWKKNGWDRFLKVDISDCEKETPECQMHLHIFPDSDVRNAKPYRKCCVEHRMLRDVALWTIERLELNKVEYFLSTGTALGARRHHGTIIPWDTDVDIAVAPKFEKQIETIFRNNSERYFHRDTLGKRMFWVHHSPTGKPAGGPHAEIFFESDYTKHPESLYPLEKCLLYTREVSCPNLKMFDVWFPKGWKSYGGDHYHDDCRTTVYEKGKRREITKC